MSECDDLRDNSSCSDNLCLPSQIKLTVYPQVFGGTVIRWSYTDRDLLAESGLQVQIEFSPYAVSDNTAWTIVRAYAADTGYWTDTAQRAFGRRNYTHYRISVLDVALNEVWSQPKRADSYIPPAFDTTFRELVRRWSGRANRGELRKGTLLKRRTHATRCSVCRDRDSGVQLISQCLTCYGTGRTGGYYKVPICVYVEFSPMSISHGFDANKSYFEQGPDSQVTLLNIPQVFPGDVWVEDSTDHRWELGNMVYAQKIGSVECLAKCEASRIDFTDVIYQFPVRS